MKKTLRTLFAVLALTLCLCLPAFAQEAKPAQPAAKEDKTVTDLTGRDAFLRDVKGFTTNFGGPYVFEQASRKSPADIYGAAPAEGSVAVLRIYTMSDDKGDASINASGHAFVSVTNVSDSDIAVRDIGHRHKSMAAGVDGGIALVIRHGVDTQHGHGTLCRGSTVDVGRGLAAGLLKDIRPAKVGGKAFYVPQKGIPAGQVGDRFVLFRGGLGGLCLLCKGRQAEAEGQGQHGKQSAERFFHGNVLHYSMKCCKILGNAAV